jgi:hypothetical protein
MSFKFGVGLYLDWTVCNLNSEPIDFVLLDLISATEVLDPLIIYLYAEWIDREVK